MRSFENTCGTYVTDGVDFNQHTVTPAYADLDLTITPPTQIVADGGTATFNVTLDNNGTASADDWTVTHTLGAGYTNLTSTVGSVVGQQVIFDSSGGGVISPSGQLTYTITADVGTGSLVHDAEVIGQCVNAGGAATGCNYSDDGTDRKSTRLNSSHIPLSRMPSSA